MTEEAPKYYTNTLSPISPLPVHPPEPEKIPILQNQIDPVFNMTSTHLVPDLPSLATSAEPLPEPTPADSPSSSHSSFSDAYAEEPEPVTSHTIGDAEKGAEDSDDYAMTFDSDAEDQADNEEVLRAVAEPASNTLPIITNTTNLSAPPTSMDYASAISDMPTIGQDLLQTHTHINLSPPHSPSNERARAHAYDDPVAQTAAAAESASSTYEDTASSGIDIQQLLDNITANAEKNAPPSANGTPPLASPSLIKSGSGLPSHASLPPRPNVPQKRPFHEDIQKYHAGVPGIPPASSAFRAGTTGSLVAAGAPGTSTDPRGGLPPPPTGSFQSPSSGNISPTSYSQINKLVPGVQSRANELQDEADDIDAKWGPDVQKIYDQFIDNERMYVTEGLWDRFPVGSRLFIGTLNLGCRWQELALTILQAIFQVKRLRNEIFSMFSINMGRSHKYQLNKLTVSSNFTRALRAITP
jgi:nuclear polyadenylated RNA-binding protein 3